MKQIKLILLSFVCTAAIAQPQMHVNIGPSNITQYGGANIQNDGGFNLGFSFGPVVTAALINGVTYSAQYQPFITTVGEYELRTYDTGLVSASGIKLGLHLVVSKHVDRCSASVATGCAATRIEPGGRIVLP